MKKHLFAIAAFSAITLIVSAAEKTPVPKVSLTDCEYAVDRSLFFKTERVMINEDLFLEFNDARKNMMNAFYHYCENPNEKTLPALKKAVDKAVECQLKINVYRAERTLDIAKKNQAQKDAMSAQVLRFILNQYQASKYVPGTAGKK